jgi:hypothetical protein
VRVDEKLTAFWELESTILARHFIKLSGRLRLAGAMVGQFGVMETHLAPITTAGDWRQSLHQK